MKARISRAAPAIAVLLLAIASTARAGVTFESLPAGSDTIGMGQVGGISSDGSTIVGSSWSVSKWEGESFRWTRAGGVQFLESSLPLASRAAGTSGTGNVIGGQRFSDYGSAFCWTSGSMRSLVANRGSAVFDVSKDGKTIVGSNPAVNTVAPVATKWSLAGAGSAPAISLGDLAGGVAESEARRISGDGTTIVGWGSSANGVEAFRIQGTGAMTALGDLAGGKYFSEAASVSTDGSVVVGRGNSANGPEAFRWTAATGMVGLGALPGPQFYSEATGVSGDGKIVIGTSSSSTDTEVFVWDSVGGMRSLRSLCRAAGMDLNGWRFSYTRAVISEDGNVLSGDAISPQMDQVMWRLAGVRELVALPVALFWQGDAVANIWQIGCASVWDDGSGPEVFSNGRPVNFDDFGSNAPDVNLTGTLAPASVVVNATQDFTFGGAGTLSGTMALTKFGPGTLTITGTHSFSGGIFVNEGSVIISGMITDTGTNGIQIAAGATLTLLGGTLNANVRIAAGGFLNGTGIIAGNVTNYGTVTAGNGGKLSINGNVANYGTMRLTNGTMLELAGSMTNYGVIDVITGALKLPATFSNSGVILDSSSVKVSELVKTGGDMRLSVPSVIGHNYQLQRNTSLEAGGWQTIGQAQAGTGRVLTFTDTGGATSDRAFYRVLVAP